jgi:molecular chaperone GrpE
MDEQQNQENLESQLKDCLKTSDEYLAGWQRCKADFSNYQKQEGERLKSLLEFSKAGYLLPLLAIYDNFERSQNHTPQELKDSDWLKGIKQIQNQFWDFLKDEGIEEIPALSQKFNPSLHEAIAQVEATGQESDTVVEVLEKGYLLNGQLLRPSKVKVTK